MRNVYADREYAGVVADLKKEMHRLQQAVGDKPQPEVG
jgi:hypothetical protein